jgi:ABC-type cobalamin/Fe3+-siderophores transport system ATPase subunit
MDATLYPTLVSTPILRAESVEFGHQGTPFLSVQELNLMAGSLIGLVGPNGAGKSTLLRLLAGLLRPQHGIVHICGQSVERLPDRERARLLAWVPQRAETPFEWTVREMVALGRHPHLGSRLRSRNVDDIVVDDALQQVGLDTLRDRWVSTLSGGEWQRALIARALVQEPMVLLLDEPVANLDLAYQRQIYEILQGLCRRRGIGVVAADHHLDLQAQFCDELVLMDHGKVVAQGRPEAILTREKLEAIFRTPLQVVPDPQTGRPNVRWRFGQGLAGRSS